MAETAKGGTTRRSVLVVDCAETLGLGVAAGVTGSVALRAQTAVNAADVAVQVFLLIGVLSSARPPDQAHPLGYGRERFFRSLLAALRLQAKQLLIVALLQVHDRPVAGTGDLDHRGAVRRGVRQRRQPVQEPRSRHRQADPRTLGQKSAAAAA
jgi:Cation efflux family